MKSLDFEAQKLYLMRWRVVYSIWTECNRIVKDFNLSNKEWVNLKTILNGMFEYACQVENTGENV